MNSLQPLVRLLQRSLHLALLRRMIAWLACAVLVNVLGGAVGQMVGDARVFRLGLLMTALSALPAFLFWPLSEKRLRDRFRRLDQEMVFEAYLEAEPGQIRDLLRKLATERASELAFLQPPREPLLAGLGRLLATAIGCLVLVEAGALLLLGRPLTLGLASPPAPGMGMRIEEQGFSDFATEAPAARQARHGRALRQEERETGPGDRAALGRNPGTTGRVTAARRTPATTGDPLGALAAQETIAKRKQGDIAGNGISEGSNPLAPGPHGNQRSANPRGEPPPGGMPQGAKKDPAPTGVSPTSGRTGSGYEHTADTRVPSPLVDYRTRLETRYTERTGRQVAASGHMGFGELRDFQRSYFDSFILRAEVGATEDPYVALLKQRWLEAKRGAR